MNWKGYEMTGRAYSPVPFSDVRITGPFWRERLEVVLERTIPSQHAKLDEVGILESAKLPQPPPPLRIPRNSHGVTMQMFWDSDFGKWIEAASYALAHRRDADIEAKIEAIVDDLERVQSPDGYLNCWYNGREPEKRWTNLRDNHELYCAGHMLEGAIAYYRATGRRRFLDIMERYVDHIAAVFGRGPGQKRGYPGHQEIELALVKLYRLTGDRRRLDLAAYFIDQRGREPHYFTEEALRRGDDPANYWAGTYEYNQAHIPVREQTRVVGHAVRAMYMASGMADLAFELRDEGLKRACEALWRDVTTAQMYVTAGLGPKESNEGFTEPYDLPNETAYAETCASVALIFWAQRMLHLDLDGRYADVMELALFNGALTGLARDGTHYFYSNPLESRGQHQRWAWHACPCCTMNVSRLVASVAGYALSTSEDGVAFHLYGGFETTVTLAGVKVVLARVERLSVVRRGQDRHRSRGAGGIRSQTAHSRLGEGRDSGSQRRGARARAGQRLRDHPPALAQGRRGDARPQDAARAALRPSERAHGCGAGGAEARSVDLLRRGGRQSRRTSPGLGAAALGAARRRMAAGSARRRHDGHGECETARSRKGRSCALLDRPAHSRGRRRSSRCPITSGPIARRARCRSGSRRPTAERYAPPSSFGQSPPPCCWGGQAGPAAVQEALDPGGGPLARAAASSYVACHLAACTRDG